MHVDSVDSNLYTSIPHASLKRALVSLIKEAYKVRDSIFIVVNSLYPIVANSISALFYGKTYFWHTRRTAIAQILQ